VVVSAPNEGVLSVPQVGGLGSHKGGRLGPIRTSDVYVARERLVPSRASTSSAALSQSQIHFFPCKTRIS